MNKELIFAPPQAQSVDGILQCAYLPPWVSAAVLGTFRQGVCLRLPTKESLGPSRFLCESHAAARLCDMGKVS